MIRSVMNIKGGVAKTLTSVQLAAGLAKKGKKCLLIDADAQGSSSRTLLPDHYFYRSGEPTLGDVLLKKVEIHDCIYHTRTENLDIIPATYELAADVFIMQSPAFSLAELRLKSLLKEIEDEYDEVIIDNNADYNILLMNSTYAADEIIIPTSLDRASIEGVDFTLRKCKEMVESFDRESSLKYTILILKVTRTRIDRDVCEELRKVYQDNVYDTQIRFQANPVKQADYSYS